MAYFCICITDVVVVEVNDVVVAYSCTTYGVGLYFVAQYALYQGTEYGL